MPGLYILSSINLNKASNVKQTKFRVCIVRCYIVEGYRVSIVKARVASKDVFYHPTRLPLRGECAEATDHTSEAFKAIRWVFTQTAF